MSSQPSSQTVPHTPLCRTSTRPDRSSGPPTRRVLAATQEADTNTPRSVCTTAQATGVCYAVDQKGASLHACMRASFHIPLPPAWNGLRP